MIYTLTLFIALFVAILTLMLGSGLLGSLLSLRLSLDGFSDPLIGLIMSGFYLGLVVGPFICPAIVHRTGHIRAFAVFAAVNTATALLYPLSPSAPLWFCYRILTGIAMMGLYMVVESWLNDRTEARMRGRVFSVYMAMTFLGLGFGQLFLMAGDITSNDLFLVAGIFSVLCLVPVAMTRSISPTLPDVVTMKLRELTARAPMGLLGAFVTGMIASAFYSMAPVFAAKSGLDVEAVAYFMGLSIICGFVMQWPVGSLSDRLDRQKVLTALTLLISLAGGLVILTAGHPLWSFYLAAGVYGGLAFTLYPVAVAHTNDHIEIQQIIPASSVLIFCYGLGACFGPIGASTCMALVGPPGLYLFILTITGLFGAVLILYRYFGKAKPEEPVPYVALPRTSPVITAIHPYSEVVAAEEERPAGPREEDTYPAEKTEPG